MNGHVKSLSGMHSSNISLDSSVIKNVCYLIWIGGKWLFDSVGLKKIIDFLVFLLWNLIKYDNTTCTRSFNVLYVIIPDNIFFAVGWGDANLFNVFETW